MSDVEFRILYPDQRFDFYHFARNIQTWFLLVRFLLYTDSRRNQRMHRYLWCPEGYNQLWCKIEKYIINFSEFLCKLFLDVGIQKDGDQTFQITIREKQWKGMPYLTRSGAFSLWTPKSSTIFSRRISSLFLLLDMLIN